MLRGSRFVLAVPSALLCSALPLPWWIPFSCRHLLRRALPYPVLYHPSRLDVLAESDVLRSLALVVIIDLCAALDLLVAAGIDHGSGPAAMDAGQRLSGYARVLEDRRLAVAGPAARRRAGRRRRPREPLPRPCPGVRDDRSGLDNCLRAGRKRATCSSSGSLTASAATSRPLGQHRCRTCRPAAWACGCSPAKGAQIDITTAASRLVFGIFAAALRELIGERTLGRTQGHAGARTQGWQEGSPCQKLRCGSRRPQWRTATHRCHSRCLTRACGSDEVAPARDL